MVIVVQATFAVNNVKNSLPGSLQTVSDAKAYDYLYSDKLEEIMEGTSINVSAVVKHKPQWRNVLLGNVGSKCINNVPMLCSSSHNIHYHSRNWNVQPKKNACCRGENLERTHGEEDNYCTY
uniref:Recep_L_domain domain-containing protein n=1 Tax=Caenorhabditis tropicalis TaxID=1561998 RepID=A0A1I7U1T9_9PELO